MRHRSLFSTPTSARFCRSVAMGVASAIIADIARGQSPPAATTFALTRVTVVDPVSDTALRDATIVVTGERIVAVGARRTVAIPRGATVIDGSGKYVIPGLWDMHAHIAQPLAPGFELEANSGYFLPLFLAFGVTGVRDVAGDLATLRRWRDDIVHGKRAGPRLLFTGEKLGKGPVVSGAPFPVDGVLAIEQSVRALRDSGASFVKVDDVRPDLFGVLTREAWKFELPVVGHVESRHSVRALARAGMRSVEHLDGVLLAAHPDEDALRHAIMQGRRPTLWHRLLVKLGVRERMPYPEATLAAGYDAVRGDSLFDLFRQTGTWHCPTLRLLGALYHQTDPNLRLAPDSLLTTHVESPSNGFAYAPFAATHPLAGVYPRMQEVVRSMAGRRVGLLAGTDTPGLFAVPGRSLHEELGLMVAAGLTPREALRAATTGPADFLDSRDSLGTIRAGAFADLVLLDADPMVDIAHTQRIRSVVARGRYFDRAALDGMIGAAAQVARRVRGTIP